MHILFNLLIIVLCLFIFYQDLKYRAVIWVSFLLLFIVLFSHSLIKIRISEIVFDRILINLFILLIVSSGIVLYFSLKGDKIKNIMSKKIGLGDVFFLLAITTYFTPFTYCFFIIFGSFISIISKIIYDFIMKEKSLNIPFAGNLALILAIFVLLNDFKIIPDIFENINPILILWNY